MRALLNRLIAIGVALSLLGLPLIATRAGHTLSGPVLALDQHDHHTHSHQPNHGVPHDKGLDSARCALACASLPALLPVPDQPDAREIDRLVPSSSRWLDLPAPPRLERPPRIASAD